MQGAACNTIAAASGAATERWEVGVPTPPRDPSSSPPGHPHPMITQCFSVPILPQLFISSFRILSETALLPAGSCPQCLQQARAGPSPGAWSSSQVSATWVAGALPPRVPVSWELGPGFKPRHSNTKCPKWCIAHGGSALLLSHLLPAPTTWLIRKAERQFANEQPAAPSLHCPLVASRPAAPCLSC